MMRVILVFVLVAAAFAENLERNFDTEEIDPMPCSFAEDVIAVVQGQIKGGHERREELESIVKIMCRLDKSDSCRTLVLNMDSIIHLTSDGSRASEIAQTLGVCPFKAQKPLQQPQGSPECTACKALLTVVYYQVKFANKTIEFIEKEIKELCAVLHSEVCELVIRELDMIIQLILKGFTPEEICEKLGFCSKHLEDNHTRQESSSSILCEACEDIVNLIHYEIKYANATIEMVEDIVRLLCEATHSEVCEAILHHLDSIIKWIEDGIDPAGICQELHFCPTPKAVNLKFQNNCTVCKAVLHLAKQDVPEAEMHAAVELTCRLLGEKYKSECDHIRENLGNIMADPKHKSLDKKCASLGYCPSEMKVKVDWCEQCRIFTSFVESQIKLSNASIHMIMDVVERICEIFGSEEKKMCDVVIKNLLRFSEMIMEGLEPKKICEELGLCPSQDGDVSKDGKILFV